ncbi:MAG: ketoacyl-ACP synthase III [Desulfuromonadaceae bacterium]|nr:ketoacyl-ACP synthase III [Desulfuromonadaceae bacterium]
MKSCWYRLRNCRRRGNGSSISADSPNPRTVYKPGGGVIRAKIAGTGSYIPEKVATNFDLEKFLDTSDEWIVSRTGIRERHIAAECQNASDLATEAARKALEMAGVAAEEIDLIIVGTITGEFTFPSAACMVQKNLGARRAVAFDVSAACSGFIFALANAVNYHRIGTVKRSLVIGSEIMTRTVNWKDRNTCVLFGDGAGAVVLSSEEGEGGILSTHLHTDGNYWELLYQLSGSASPSFLPEVEDQGRRFVKMQGNEVFKVAVKALSDVALEALAANGLTKDDLKLIFPHQANKRILDAIGKRLDLPSDKIFVNVDRVANTSSASIPIALDEANRRGLLAPQDLILLNAFGGGFTWGAALIRW